MRFPMIAFTAVAVMAAGCEPAADKATETAPKPAATPAAAEAPTAPTAPVVGAIDWRFMSHGGSGDLAFGDGDWAEGVALVSLSCLPGSGRVTLQRALDDGESPQITLTSADATETFAGESGDAGVEATADAGRPVLKALRRDGAVVLTTASGSRTLIGSETGRVQVEQFFAYCG